MALLETKIIQVKNDPSSINQSNEEWGHFGWSVQNVQVTHSQNTKTYKKELFDVIRDGPTPGDPFNEGLTVETTTINYATITYQRDKHMTNYHELAQLESEYWGLRIKITGLNEQFQDLLKNIDKVSHPEKQFEAKAEGCMTTAGVGCLIYIVLGGSIALVDSGGVLGILLIALIIGILLIRSLLTKKKRMEKAKAEKAKHAQREKERQQQLAEFQAQRVHMLEQMKQITTRLEEIPDIADTYLV